MSKKKKKDDIQCASQGLKMMAILDTESLCGICRPKGPNRQTAGLSKQDVNTKGTFFEIQKLILCKSKLIFCC